MHQGNKDSLVVLQEILHMVEAAAVEPVLLVMMYLVVLMVVQAVQVDIQL